MLYFTNNPDLRHCRHWCQCHLNVSHQACRQWTVKFWSSAGHFVPLKLTNSAFRPFVDNPSDLRTFRNCTTVQFCKFSSRFIVFTSKTSLPTVAKENVKFSHTAKTGWSLGHAKLASDTRVSSGRSFGKMTNGDTGHLDPPEHWRANR